MKKMLAIAAIGFFLIGMLVSFAQALPRVEINQLRKLDLRTRLEQRCDIEAMVRLRHESTWAPDTRYWPMPMVILNFADTGFRLLEQLFALKENRIICPMIAVRTLIT